MSTLAVRAAMAIDEVLRPRVATAMVRVALEVISEPPMPDTEIPAKRANQARRRQYALAMTNDVMLHAGRTQWALASWEASTLAEAYVTGGGGEKAITDTQLITTLRQMWDATGGLRPQPEGG